MSKSPPRAVALITGAAKRIGAEIARRLAQKGWYIALHYNLDHEAAEKTAHSIRKTGGIVELFPADLEDELACQNLIPEVCQKMAPPSLLINNAAIFEPDDLLSMDATTWHRHQSINLYAPLLLCQGMVKALKEEKGVIINLLDQKIRRMTPDFLSYTISKYGLWAATQSLACGLAPQIRVMGIGPGPTLPHPRQSQEHFDNQAQSTLLQQAVSPSDIVRAVEFILDTPSLTGQILLTDSGEHLSCS